MAMKKAIRCCISCILPCGALDVIRIVHANGKVEEICESHVKASEIMKLYPKHVLKKPSTCSSDDGICPKIVVVPPDAELQRGKIYFLMPLPPSSTSSDDSKSRSRSSSRKKKARSFSNNNSSSSQLLPQEEVCDAQHGGRQQLGRAVRRTAWRQELCNTQQQQESSEELLETACATQSMRLETCATHSPRTRPVSNSVLVSFVASLPSNVFLGLF